MVTVTPSISKIMPKYYFQPLLESVIKLILFEHANFVCCSKSSTILRIIKSLPMCVCVYICIKERMDFIHQINQFSLQIRTHTYFCDSGISKLTDRSWNHHMYSNFNFKFNIWGKTLWSCLSTKIISWTINLICNYLLNSLFVCQSPC